VAAPSSTGKGLAEEGSFFRTKGGLACVSSERAEGPHVQTQRRHRSYRKAGGPPKQSNSVFHIKGGGLEHTKRRVTTTRGSRPSITATVGHWKEPESRDKKKKTSYATSKISQESFTSGGRGLDQKIQGGRRSVVCFNEKGLGERHEKKRPRVILW